MKRIAAAALALVACQRDPSSPARAIAGLATAASAAASLPAPGSAEPALNAAAPRGARVAWQSAFDLDGDGRDDTIHVDFSGGAHCCYRVSVTLTSMGATIHVPFQLDGGYVGGLDLSQLDHFDVRTIEGPLPEIVMEIETYNGKGRPLPEEWKQRYGISTHRISLGFSGGKLRVRDVPGVNGAR
jgi:hypothetical protein